VTPIGHFTSSAVTAGTAGFLKPKEVFIVGAYYVLFLIVFHFLAVTYGPGMWGMDVYNTASDIPFYGLLIFWFRRGTRGRKLALCVGIGALVLSAYSHLFDKITLHFLPDLPEGMWRPHNVFHTPFAAIALSALAAPLLAWGMKLPDRRTIFGALALGYLLHIFVDTTTYNYPIYWLWPFSDLNTDFIHYFQAPDVSSKWLGDPFFVASPPVHNNPQGYIMYVSEPLINLAMLFFYGVVVAVRRVDARAVDGYSIASIDSSGQ
jgi:hypothetical protein